MTIIKSEYSSKTLNLTRPESTPGGCLIEINYYNGALAGSINIPVADVRAALEVDGLGCGCDEADENLKAALAERDELKAKLAEAERSLVELAPAEVLVEGSWFKVADLPKVLGNHMRNLDEYSRGLKESAIALEKARAERDEARAAVMKLIRLVDTEEAP